MIFGFPSADLVLFVVLISMQDYKFRRNITRLAERMKSIRKQLDQIVYFFSLPNGVFCSHAKCAYVTQSLTAFAYFSPNLCVVSPPSQFIFVPTPYLRSNSVVVVTSESF